MRLMGGRMAWTCKGEGRVLGVPPAVSGAPASPGTSQRIIVRVVPALVVGMAGLAGILLAGLIQRPQAVDGVDPLAGAGMVACGAALGVSLCDFARMWTALVVGMRPRSAILTTGLALVVCGVGQAAFALVREPWAGALLGMLTELLCAAALVAALRAEGRWAQASCTASAGSGEGMAPGKPGPQQREDRRRMLFALSDGAGRLVSTRTGAPRLRDACAMAWISIASLAFCGFITGLTWDPVASEEVAWRGATISAVGVMAGAYVCAVILLLVWHRRDEVSSLAVLTRVLEPVSLAIVLVVPIVKQWTDYTLVLSVATSVFSIVGFAMITSVAFVEAVAILRFGGLSYRLVVPAVTALLAGSLACGMVSIGFLGSSGRILCFVLEAALFTAVAISFAMRSRGISAGASSAGTAGDVPEAEAGGRADEGPGAPDLVERCRGLADSCGLSPREAEVLLYLGRGYGSAYIAAQLGISENTVRTHVRHIYEKLGVSSREGLIARVDGTDKVGPGVWTDCW